MNYDKEYDALRKEIEENKKYVLERPTLIIGLGVAAAGKEGFVYLIPPLLIFLLLFNLWLTINRLESSARLVAYIQIFIEKNREYIGWENFLRVYRKVVATLGKKKIKQLVNDKLDPDFIPDNLRFYAIVWWFHAIAITVCTVVSIFLYRNAQNDSSALELQLSMMASIMGLLFTILLSVQKGFGKMKKIIEVERAIVETVLEQLEHQKNSVDTQP